MKAQSVICSKSRFSSAGEAASWCRKNGFKTEKVDETETSYRFRQFPPDQCNGGIKTINLTEGVSATVCDAGTKVFLDFPFEVKRDEAGMYVKGYASQELWDKARDYIPAETHFKALTRFFENNTPICFMHIKRLEDGEVVFEKGGELEELAVIEDGLYVKVRPLPWVEPLIDLGLINGFSIGYKVYVIEEIDGGRKFVDWDLWEISLVDNPCNQGCYFESEVKMLPKGMQVRYDAARKALSVDGLGDDLMKGVVKFFHGLLGSDPTDRDEVKSAEEVMELSFKRESLAAESGGEDEVNPPTPQDEGGDMAEEVKGQTPEEIQDVEGTTEEEVKTDNRPRDLPEEGEGLSKLKEIIESERKSRDEALTALVGRVDGLESKFSELIDILAETPAGSTVLQVNGIEEEKARREEKADNPFKGIFG